MVRASAAIRSVPVYALHGSFLFVFSEFKAFVYEPFEVRQVRVHVYAVCLKSDQFIGEMNKHLSGTLDLDRSMELFADVAC